MHKLKTAKMWDKVKLQSSDGVVFAVDKKVATWIPTIKPYLEYIEQNKHGMENQESPIIPMENTIGHVLFKIIVWIKHYQAIVDSDDPGTIVSFGEEGGWESDFFNVDRQTYLDILLAASNLEIPGLLNMALSHGIPL